MTSDDQPSERESVTYGRREVLRVGVGLFVLSTVIGTWLFVGVRTETGVAGDPSTIVGVVASGVLTVAVTVGLHEAVHAVVGTLLGYQVRVGVGAAPLSFYTVAPDQYWTRRDLLIAAIAPFILVNAASITVIVTGPTWLAIPAVLAVMTNSVGAAADLLIVTRVLDAPPGTRYYDVGDGAGYRIVTNH